MLKNPYIFPNVHLTITWCDPDTYIRTHHPHPPHPPIHTSMPSPQYLAFDNLQINVWGKKQRKHIVMRTNDIACLYLTTCGRAFPCWWYPLEPCYCKIYHHVWSMAKPLKAYFVHSFKHKSYTLDNHPEKSGWLRMLPWFCIHALEPVK